MTKRKKKTDDDWLPFTTDPAHCVILDDTKNTVSVVIYRKRDRAYKYTYPELELNQENFSFCTKVAMDLNRESKKVAW